MDDLKLKELTNLRNEIIKRHLILIILSLIISLFSSIFYFYIKQKINSFYFLLILISCHCPIYLIIYHYEKHSNLRYQYLMGFSLILILGYSLAVIFIVKTIYYQFFCYLITLSIYHYTEFFSELLFHFKDLQRDAFLIYENKKWVIATLASFIETLLGTYFFHKYKNIKILFFIGLLMTIVGQYFRIAALFTGKHNFTHKIQLRKRKNHVLVKEGVYKICRHPSYFGFFIWSVGIEIMCVNPLCTIAFSYILFIFFKKRIEIEEEYLIRFFGMEYIIYRRDVGTIIPFANISEETEKKNLNKYFEIHKDINNYNNEHPTIYDLINERNKNNYSNSDSDSDDDKKEKKD